MCSGAALFLKNSTWHVAFFLNFYCLFYLSIEKVWLKFFNAIIKKTLCSCISHKNSSGRTAQPNHNQNAQFTFSAHDWYVLLFVSSSLTLYVRLRLRYTRRNRCLFWGKFPSSIASSFYIARTTRAVISP